MSSIIDRYGHKAAHSTATRPSSSIIKQNGIIMAARTLPAPTQAGPARFIAISATAAVVAALAAYLSVLSALPAWAMFMGWVAYYSRGHSARDGARNFACFAIGLVIGVEATVAVAALAPVAGILSLPLVVIAVALVVVSLRAVPEVNNVPAYFMGLITVFAAHLEPTFVANAGLGAAGALGCIAAWAASTLQGRLSVRAVRGSSKVSNAIVTKSVRT